MELESSLPHSQQPVTCPYPKPDQSSPCSAAHSHPDPTSWDVKQCPKFQSQLFIFSSNSSELIAQLSHYFPIQSQTKLRNTSYCWTSWILVFCVASHRVTCFRVATILNLWPTRVAQNIVDNCSVTNSTDIGIITVNVLSFVMKLYTL